ncbi:MAG: PadR family transcriptional regulator [archaeon]
MRFYTLRLLKEKPRSGYELMREIAERTFGAWRPASGSIYPTLMEMEDIGEIEEERPSEPGGRGKKIFKLTKKGENSLREWEEGKKELLDKASKLRAFWRELYEPSLRESIIELETGVSRIAKAIPQIENLDSEERKSLQNKLSSTQQELHKIIMEFESKCKSRRRRDERIGR